jgi:hypothetical protein
MLLPSSASERFESSKMRISYAR